MKEQKASGGKHCPFCGAKYRISVSRMSALHWFGTIDIKCHKCKKKFKITENGVAE